jgi:ElaB/YqjD/DUF883 family membrane-anchored ribosome-binding protein
VANYASETQQEEDQGAVGKAASSVSEAASTAQEKVGEKAGELRSQGRERLRHELDTRTTSVGQDTRSLAEALRSGTDRLRSEGRTPAAGIADGVADRVERLGDYLERSDGDAMLRDAERLARSRPWVFAGLGAIVGVATARFVKASSDRRSGMSESDSGRYQTSVATGEAAFASPGAVGGSTDPSLDDPAGAPLARDQRVDV